MGLKLSSPLFKLGCRKRMTTILYFLFCKLQHIQKVVRVHNMDVVSLFTYNKIRQVLEMLICIILYFANVACCKYIVYKRPLFNVFRYSSHQRRVSKARTARRKARKRRRNRTNPKLLRGKTARNRATSSREAISVRKYSPPWKSIKKCSSSLGYIPRSPPPV